MCLENMKQKNLSSLRDKYAGRPAAILGGGPSLPEDLKRIPRRSLLFAVNHHAHRIGIKTDFLVFWDCPTSHRTRELGAALETYKGIKISPILPYSDVDFEGVELPPDPGFTSPLAAWLALYMGCSPVLLCGMDCYQGPVKFCHPSEVKHPCHDYPLHMHLDAWRRAAENLPESSEIRAVSGPLVEIFGKYEEKRQ